MGYCRAVLTDLHIKTTHAPQIRKDDTIISQNAAQGLLPYRPNGLAHSYYPRPKVRKDDTTIAHNAAHAELWDLEIVKFQNLCQFSQKIIILAYDIGMVS